MVSVLINESHNLTYIPVIIRIYSSENIFDPDSVGINSQIVK